jgi:bacteriocin-like protein
MTISPTTISLKRTNKKNKSAVELSEEELKRVSGGVRTCGPI